MTPQCSEWAALKQALIVAGAAPDRAEHGSTRIEFVTRDYVDSGPFRSDPDIKTRGDLVRLGSALVELDDALATMCSTADVCIALDLYSEEGSSFAPVDDSVRRLHGRMRPYGEFIEAIGQNWPVRTGAPKNESLHQLWRDAAQHWKNATGSLPASTTAKGAPLAPLFKHVGAIVWELTDAEDLREPVAGHKPFLAVLKAMRNGEQGP